MFYCTPFCLELFFSHSFSFPPLIMSRYDNSHIDDDAESFASERKRIRAAFDLFDRDKKRVVVKE